MAEIVHPLDAKQIRLIVKLPRLFGFRMWLMVKLVQLAGIVSPMTIEIEAGR